MNKLAIMNKMPMCIHKAGFQIKKHSPEILVVTGIVGAVASAVMACKATLKVNEVVSEAKENIDKIHVATEKGVTEAGQEYTLEDSKKDLTIEYTKTAVKMVKLYGPALLVGTLSITGILASNNILRKRNVALAAAYTTIDKSFRDYRNRVIERFGEKVDKELKYNIKEESVTKTVKDEETGKTKKVKESKFIVNPSDISGYARFFEKYTTDEDGNTVVNPNWQSTNEYNLFFIKAQERYANDLLVSRKRVFLNEVYRMLGLPETKAGQVVGWVYDPENGKGDNYIDFGLYKDNLSYSDFVNGHDNAILLDFNVDGNIWELMK